MKRPDVIVTGKFVENKHAFAVVLDLLFLRTEFFLNDFDVVLTGQKFQCVVIGELFVFHNEMHHVAAFAATETLTDASGRRNTERWGLVVVKRTKTNIINASFTKRDKIAHNFFNVGCIQDAVYGVLINHSSKKYTKIWTKVINKSQSSV